MPVFTYRSLRPLAWLLLGVSLVGCRVNRTRQTPIFTAEGYCYVSPPAAPLMDSLWMLQIDRDSAFSPAVQRRFSQRARSVAADIGIQAILTDWVRAEAQFKAQPTDANRSQLVMLRHDITDRILLATQELTTVLAELACERTRATELKNYLQQQTDKRVFRLTIMSVLAGALSTVVSGTLAIVGADDPYVEGVAMGGAVLSGYWALRASGGFEEADFSHRRNHLTDVREAPRTSRVYPPIVWHFLTRELEPDKQTQTVRETILERWTELDVLNETATDEQRRQEVLLFGPGGRYKLSDISRRISLMDVLQLEVGSMYQELKQLQQELVLSR
jgi:hypothetical protein